jgi:hypothetical protein
VGAHSEGLRRFDVSLTVVQKQHLVWAQTHSVDATCQIHRVVTLVARVRH